MQWAAIQVPFSVILLTLDRVSCLCDSGNFSSPIANYSRLQDLLDLEEIMLLGLKHVKVSCLRFT